MNDVDEKKDGEEEVDRAQILFDVTFVFPRDVVRIVVWGAHFLLLSSTAWKISTTCTHGIYEKYECLIVGVIIFLYTVSLFRHCHDVSMIWSHYYFLRTRY